MLVMDDGEPVYFEKVLLLADGSTVAVGSNYNYNVGESTWYALMKFGVDGDVLWSKELPVDAQGFSSTVYLHSGNIYVNYYSADSFWSSEVQYLMKFSLNGDLLGAVSRNISEGHFNDDKIVSLPNGNNMAMLRTIDDMFEVLCFDVDLNLLWSRLVDPDPTVDDKQTAEALSVNSAGDILIAGNTYGRLFTSSFTSDGQFLFGRTYASDSIAAMAYGVHAFNGGMMVAGRAYTIGSWWSGNYSFTCAIDSDGAVSWFRTTTDAHNSFYNFHIVRTHTLPNGNFWFDANGGASNKCIGEFDTDGKVLWSKRFSNVTYQHSANATSITGNGVISVQSANVYPYGEVVSCIYTDYETFRNSNICDYASTTPLSQLINFQYESNSVVTNPAIQYVSVSAVLADAPPLEASEICLATAIESSASLDDFSLQTLAGGQLNVSVSRPLELSVYNLLGQSALKLSLEAGVKIIDISGLASGVYIAVGSSKHSQRSRLFAKH